MIDIPEIAPYTAAEAHMIDEDMQLTRMLETLDLDAEDRDELWQRKLDLEARYQVSRQRTHTAWVQQLKADRRG